MEEVPGRGRTGIVDAGGVVRPFTKRHEDIRQWEVLMDDANIAANVGTLDTAIGLLALEGVPN